MGEHGSLREIDWQYAAVVIVNAVQWNATYAFLHGTRAEIAAIATNTADMVTRYIFRDSAE